MKHRIFLFLILSVLIILLFLGNLFIGSIHIPSGEVIEILIGGTPENSVWRFIVLDSRLPQGLTAILAGAGLGASGLLLQTAFQNPLAGPSILGISSGASLGVAVVMMTTAGLTSSTIASYGMNALVVGGALMGSLVIMFALILLSISVRNKLMLLIAGILIGYLTSSVVTLLSSLSTAKGIQGYVAWGLGTFSEVEMSQMPVFSTICCLGLISSMLMAKPLNLLLLGSSYAKNLGISGDKTITLLLLVTGVLTAVITAYCGPISFIGMAIPHISRFMFKTDNHWILLPGSMIWGSITALICCLLSVTPENNIIPINALTPVIGVPIIIFVIIKRRGV